MLSLCPHVCLTDRQTDRYSSPLGYDDVLLGKSAEFLLTPIKALPTSCFLLPLACLYAPHSTCIVSHNKVPVTPICLISCQNTSSSKPSAASSLHTSSNKTPRFQPGHITTTLTDSPPTLSLCHPYYLQPYNIRCLPMWLLYWDCLTPNKRAV